MLEAQIGIVVFSHDFRRGQAAFEQLKDDIEGDSSSTEARLPVVDLRVDAYVFLQ
jgi:hypothetical protein